MKMKHFLFIGFLMVASAMSAVCISCSTEDWQDKQDPKEASYSGSESGEALKIIVAQQKRQCDSTATRASISLTDAAFEAGDEIGVFAVDRNGLVTVANIPFTLSATGWSTTGNITYAPDYAYYAYYPYKSSLTGAPAIGTTITTPTADGFFSSVISSWTPLADQSSKANFNSSDLMVAKGQHTSSKSISFSMSHKMGLAVMDIIDRYYVDTHPETSWEENPEFSGNIPYHTRDRYLYIVRPATNTSVAGVTVNISKGLSKEYHKETSTAVEDYLRFHALEDGTISFSKTGLSYSTDHGTTWTALAAGAATPTIKATKTVFFKNNTTLTPVSLGGIGTFSSTGKCDVGGNVMSLLFGADFEGETSLAGYNYALKYLFKENDKIINADNMRIPATTLSEECYSFMFYRCTSLNTAPDLPATTLTLRCYENMFYSCTSLNTAPDLPATNLEQHCYSQMFSGCTSLTTAPELPATTLKNGCYYGMFLDCTSLTTAPELPATIGVSYRSMFKGCTSLTIPPELPATTLENDAYARMFEGCISLTTAPELPATTLSNSCYQLMFLNCTSLTTAPELPATTLKNGCYYRMFQGCTALTTAPKLPALTLVNNCYSFMFQNSRVNYVKAAFTTEPGSIYTDSWLNGTPASGTFYKNSAASWDVTGISGIPSGWTVYTYTP